MMRSILSLALTRAALLLAAATLAFGFLLAAAAPVAAQDTTTTPPPEPSVLGASDLLPSSFTAETGLGDADLERTIGALIQTVIRFLGIIAVIVVLYGGFRWMTASGNDEKVAEAKKILIAGLIGLAIVLTALAITTFVINQILGATGDSIDIDT